MVTGYEIIAIDAEGNEIVDPYAYREQVDAKGDVLELGRINRKLSYVVTPAEIDEGHLNDLPRFHDPRRYRKDRTLPSSSAPSFGTITKP